MENLIWEPMSVRKNSFRTRLLLLLGLVVMVQSQQRNAGNDKKRICRIMFYNTENFFDTKDDPLTNDQEFLPTSKKKWTPSRYNEKLHHIFQVIVF